jgi:hypothetical protein
VEFILWEAHGTFPILIVAGKKPLAACFMMTVLKLKSLLQV